VSSREFQDRLSRRARRAGLVLPPDLGTKLEVYFRLLSTWNGKMNLTGLDLSEPAAIDRLLIEPLVAAKHASATVTRMIDIGSGGGSPAIPLALALHRAGLLLVEAKTRKSVFLREALRALEMADAEVVTSRFEELLTRPALHEAHELLTLRAVRVETSVLMNVQAFVKPGGDLFLFRAASGAGSPGSLVPPLSWKATFPLLESQGSRLVVLEKRPDSRSSRLFHGKQYS
jgi:16S rRNA (guanine527-N7)-methyltransferase